MKIDDLTIRNEETTIKIKGITMKINEMTVKSMNNSSNCDTSDASRPVECWSKPF